MSHGDHAALRVRTEAGVARVILDHPPINLLDATMITDLDRAGRDLASDDSVRVVVLQSANPDFFIAHADLNMILHGGADPAFGRQALDGFHGAVDRFRRMPKATIAQIEGRCRGGGSELALACDMRFAARGRAVMSQPEVALGIIPGGGGSTRLPRLIGRGRALEVILGCEDFDADLAERYGYVNRALPAAEIDGFVNALARRIAGFPADAIALAKQAVAAQEPDIESRLASECECFLRAVGAEPARRLMSAALAAGLQTAEVEAGDVTKFLSRLSS